MTDVRPTKRDAILTAAAELFVAHGYGGTSLRDIGRDAGADAALVIHHFGSKDGLFVAAMADRLPPFPLTEGPASTVGERFIAYLLDAAPEVRATYLALIHASDSDAIGSELRRQHQRSVVAPLLTQMSGPDADLRASLAAAAVAGLLYSLWVIGDETLLAADRHDVVRHYGHVVQELVTPA
ncbi:MULTISPECIES: TetR/AcrR family transcriptional regulator [unclassified Curtobacterium]|uniref:TetR/AcrR family transcriptional regulator n=1 Tax=unclassified Curtobacterium TaxID=257496 RepID=UPI0023EF4A63|nr:MULTISPECIES: TetR/AcrR family transcriptional regulator [unclassified Curtobacterium]